MPPHHTSSVRAGIALGANIGDRRENLLRAVSQIVSAPFVTGRPLCSSLWETAPVDCPPGSPPFLNAVIELGLPPETAPLQLLAWLKSLETRAGRDPGAPRNSPRPLDLDLLYLGSRSLVSPSLILPHPRMALRRFVLGPLAEIRPSLRPPGWPRSVAEQLALLPPDGARPVEPPPRFCWTTPNRPVLKEACHADEVD